MSGTAALRQPAVWEDEGPAATAAARRFYDAATSAWMVKVLPGEFYVTKRSDEVLVTVLGSCVSACIRDPIAGIGGMNHFMLAQSNSGRWGSDQRSTRFGNFAMEKLINELIKAGCWRSRMEIKVFGGGNVIESNNEVGSDNAEFVLDYLQAEGLRCAAQDLGGQLPRRIHYYPATGKVVRRLLAATEKSAVSREEKAYRDCLASRGTGGGDIELFN